VKTWTALGLTLLLTFALGAAARADQPGEIDRLTHQLGSPRFAEREEASKRLEALGDAAADALRKAAQSDPDAEVRWRAARLLGRLKGGGKVHEGKTITEWIRQLGQGTRDERQDAALALARLGPAGRDVLPDLQAALQDRELVVRWRAAYALWRVDSRRGREALGVLKQVAERWQEQIADFRTPADVDETRTLLAAALEIVDDKPGSVALGR
jgi:hypothetical protein